MFNNHIFKIILMLTCYIMSLNGMTPDVNQEKMELVRNKGLSWYYVWLCIPQKDCVDKIIDYAKLKLTDENKKFLASVINVPLVAKFKGLYSVNTGAFSNKDNQFFAGAGQDGTIKVWSFQTGKCTQTLKADNRSDCLAFSHDDKKLAISGFYFHRIHIWDLLTGKRDISLDQKAVYIVFSSDDKKIAFTKEDDYVLRYDEIINPRYIVKLWDLQTGACDTIVDSRGASREAVAFGHNPSLLAIGFHQGIVKLFNLQTGKQSTLEGHDRSISSVSFTKDDQELISSSYDGNVRLWNLTDNSCINSFKVLDDLSHGFLVREGGKQVVGVSDHNAIKFFDLQIGVSYVWHGHQQYTSGLAFSSDGSCLATGSKSVRIWDVQKSTSLIEKLYTNNFTFEETFLLKKYASKNILTKHQKNKLIEIGFKNNDGSFCSIQ